MSLTQDSIVIVQAKRTAIGKFAGSLSTLSASDLGAQVIQNLLQEHTQENTIDEVIMGQVLTAGCGQNPARQSVIKAGLPQSVPAMTINKVCGSGLKAVALAYQAIKSGFATSIIAGGQENMSLAPHILPQLRTGVKMGAASLQDSMIQDGLWDVYNNYHMGVTAENIAKAYNISRDAQDEFALQSQLKAEKAQKAGVFEQEIVPVAIPQRKGEPISFRHDEFIRYNCTLESLQQLKPAFDKTGTVTAGNASGINDGAAAVWVMTLAQAEKLGLTPLVSIKAFASSGLQPDLMGLGPIGASQACLLKAGWSVADLDVMEINEAFAAQALAVNQVMAWPQEKINIYGGSIALGHPIGASGCRVLVTLIHAMQKNQFKKGLASLCIGGGMGIAMAIEAI